MREGEPGVLLRGLNHVLFLLGHCKFGRPGVSGFINHVNAFDGVVKHKEGNTWERV